MPETVAIIPARYGSSRLPGKPLIDICGEPMVCHVYRRAAAIAGIDIVAVATDDERIASCIQDMGGAVFITDSSHESGTDRIAQAAREMELPPETLVVNIQGDQPLISPDPVISMTELLKHDDHIHMATAACPMRAEEVANPNRVKVVLDSSSRAIYFSRSPIPFDRDGTFKPDPSVQHGYLRHIGIYAYRNIFLQQFVSLSTSWLESMEKLEQLRAIENGFRIGVAVVQDSPLDVDTAEDLEAVRCMIEQGEYS
jgi:3-deoxy-manno-octulosonate cytidylyltransferase (CMP-KDO synthetase)